MASTGDDLSASIRDKVLPISMQEIGKWMDHFKNLHCNHGLSFSPSWTLPGASCTKSVTEQTLDEIDSFLGSGRTSGGHVLADEIGRWPSEHHSEEYPSTTSSTASDLPIPEMTEGRKLVGQGSFGTVYKVEDESGNSTLACKSVPKRVISDRMQVQDNVPRLATEIRCMQALAYHPAVVELQSVDVDNEMVHLTMSFYEGGDLLTRLREVSRFSESESATICASIASVLAHAHRKGIMHRDIKLENILLKSKESNIDVCVADFGLSTYFKQGEKLREFAGTPQYVSPNVIKRCYGPQTDLWSLGVILFALLKGTLPFHGNSEAEVVQAIANVEIVALDGWEWQSVSEHAKNLIGRLLEKNEDKRITAEEVLQHQWILANVSPLYLADLEAL